MVGSQNVAHRTNQFIAAVSHARIAELAKKPQVFAHLGIAEAEQIAQLTRGDSLLPGRLQALQFAQVEAQSGHDDLGNRGIRGKIARRRTGFIHGRNARRRFSRRLYPTHRVRRNDAPGRPAGNPPQRERPTPGKRGGVRYLANPRRKGSGSPIAVPKRSAVFLPESGGLSHRGPDEMHP